MTQGLEGSRDRRGEGQKGCEQIGKGRKSEVEKGQGEKT